MYDSCHAFIRRASAPSLPRWKVHDLRFVRAFRRSFIVVGVSKAGGRGRKQPRPIIRRTSRGVQASCFSTFHCRKPWCRTWHVQQNNSSNIRRESAYLHAGSILCEADRNVERKHRGEDSLHALHAVLSDRHRALCRVLLGQPPFVNHLHLPGMMTSRWRAQRRSAHPESVSWIQYMQSCQRSKESRVHALMTSPDLPAPMGLPTMV